MNKHLKVAISGVQGYIGRELVTLLSQHPYVHISAVHGRQKELEIYQSLPIVQQQAIPVLTLEEMVLSASQIDVIFLATPAAVSMEIKHALENTSIKIIDLSGAFRLPAEEFTRWYGMDHLQPGIDNACYGLSPWITPASNCQLIANPGCYATAALMSLLPILTEHLIESNSIIIDAKSGVSGAGKQSNPDLMFCEIANNFIPYKIGVHQHTPEISKILSNLTGKEVNIRLTTSMLPIVRGISMTIYAKANAALTDEELATAIKQAMQFHYQDYPFVRFQEVGKGSNVEDQFILSLKNVVGTPFCHIGYFVKEGLITIFSSIDNLLKGAASQAIENLNALAQWPLETGLLVQRGAL